MLLFDTLENGTVGHRIYHLLVSIGWWPSGICEGVFFGSRSLRPFTREAPRGQVGGGLIVFRNESCGKGEGLWKRGIFSDFGIPD